MRKPSHNSALIALAVVLAGCTPSQSRVETAIAYTQIAIEHALPKMTETPAVTPSATPEPTLVPTPNSTLSSYAIAFDAAIDSYGDLFIMDQAGANLENLTQSTNKEWSPVWSPDGSTMAYLSRPENWRSHIEGFVMVMGAHGENMISLTHVSQLVSEMAWSPDGTTLAIVSSGTSSDYTLSTYSFNENTLTVHIEDRPVLEGLSWLPDGQSIAITSFVAGSGLSPQGTRPVTLLVIDLESGDTSRVVELDIPSRSWISWSPEGDHFAYIDDWDEETGEGHLYVGSVEDKAPASLSLPVSRIFTGWPTWQSNASDHFAWSPDGSKIVYLWENDLYSTDLEGKSTRLTNVGEDERFGFPNDVSWSPDGSMIAFLGDVNAGVGLEIFVMLPDGSEIVRLAPDLMIQRWDWSPDSALIVAQSNGIIAPCPSPPCSGPHTEDPGIYILNVIEGTYTFSAVDGENPSFQP